MNLHAQSNATADAVASPAIMPSTPRITSAKDYLHMAHAAFQVSDLNRTRESLRAALAFQPEDERLILALGHVEFGLGMYALALQRYTVVCDMAPSLAIGHSSRALTLKLLNRSREARLAAEHALSLDIRDLVALKVLARISLDAGRHDRAREYCRRILNLNPMDAEALRLLDQCRFDLETFVAEEPAAAPLPPVAPKEEPGPQPDVQLGESVLVKFPDRAAL